MFQSRAITVSDHTTGGGERRISVTYTLPEGNPVMEDLHNGVQSLVNDARAALIAPPEPEPEQPDEPEYPEGDPEDPGEPGDPDPEE